MPDQDISSEIRSPDISSDRNVLEPSGHVKSAMRKEGIAFASVEELKTKIKISTYKTNISLSKIHLNFTQEVEVFSRYLSWIKTHCDQYEIKIRNRALTQHHQQKLIDFEFLRIKNTVHKKMDNHFKKMLQILLEQVQFSEFSLESNPLYQRYKAFYQRNLKHLFVVTDFIKQIHYKPLGYAGDFRALDTIYQQVSTHSGLYERLLDDYTYNIALAKSVRSRSDFIYSELQRISKSEIQALSVASGAAEEVNLLANSSNIQSKINLTLLDFEKKALEFSEDRQITGIGQIQTKTLRANILDIIQGSAALETYDFIYSLGLYDYLKDGIFVKLTRKLYSLLNPGGRLIIGNMSPVDHARSYMSLIGGWNLLYRTKEELEILAKKIDVSGKNFSIQVDDIGAQLYLILHK